MHTTANIQTLILSNGGNFASEKGLIIMLLWFINVLSSHFFSLVCQGGEFGAYMQVHIQNDGPVTLHIEPPQFPPAKEVRSYNYVTCWNSSTELL